MPSGMLGPASPGAAVGGGGDDPAALRLVALAADAGVPEGSVTIAIVDDPRADAPLRGSGLPARQTFFVSAAAITLLHGPLSRALPGFDLFLPRRFEGTALLRLAEELAAFDRAWTSVNEAQAARQRWGESTDRLREGTTDSEWLALRDSLSVTTRKLAELARERSQPGAPGPGGRPPGGALWIVSGP